MIHYDENIIQLIQLYLVSDLSGEEKRLLETWLQQDPSHKELFDRVCMNGDVARDFEAFEKIDKDIAWKHVSGMGGIKPTAKSKGMHWYRWVAAVMLPLMIVAVGYYIVNDSGKSQRTKYKVTEIQPGKSKAILRLDNNRVIELAGEDEVRLEVAKGVAVKNNASGVVYPEQVANKGETVYNVLEVPRGGEYKIVLADGSQVWINSQSVLEFPARFVGKERRVKLTGEAYFDVSKDVEKPFVVEVGDKEVQVLGTSFKVTGKVQVSVNDKNYILTPSMQVRIEGNDILVGKVDVREFTAWKDGLFVFKKQKLREVMDILSRWYDVDVFYQNLELQNLHFTGTIQRHSEISGVLKFLEKTDIVKFTLNGKTLIVSK